MDIDPYPTGRRQVTLIPDIVPECKECKHPEVRRFELPDHFDKVTVQEAYDKLDARKSSASGWMMIFFLLWFGFLLAAICCAFFPAIRLLAMGFLLTSVVIFLLGIPLERYSIRLSKAQSPMSSQLHEYDKRQRELAHGLRAPNECDNPVSQSEWTIHMNRTADWAFDEQKAVLPSDIVVKFGWVDGPTSGQGGYAVRRGKKIVAEYICWRS